MSETAERVALAEVMLNALRAAKGLPPVGLDEMMPEDRAMWLIETDAALAHFAELRKDKARLDWLERQGVETFGGDARIRSQIDVGEQRIWLVRHIISDKDRRFFPDFRAAIDAAMEGK